MTDRLADLGQQSEPRYCLRDWLRVLWYVCDVGSELMRARVCVCLCGGCVSFMFVLQEFVRAVRGEERGGGVDCVNDCVSSC